MQTPTPGRGAAAPTTDFDPDAPARSWRDYVRAFSPQATTIDAALLTALPIESGARQHLTRGIRWEWAALALILIVGAILRFTGLNWDGHHHLHPDERFLTMVESAIQVGTATRPTPEAPIDYRPAGLLATYFDTARSALNPNNVGHGFYVYGTFPLFLVRWLGGAFQWATYDRVHLLGRGLSGASDLITVALVYLVGRRLYGIRVGLVAAALSTFSVLQIQHAHFFVMDSFLVTLVVGCFYFCVDISETGRLRSFAICGLLFGLALATKLSMLTFIPIAGLAPLIYLWRRFAPTRGASIQLADVWRDSEVRRVVLGGALMLLIAALVFRVFQPYAFVGPGFFDIRLNPRWVDNILYQDRAQKGIVDMPPAIQWAGTEPVAFPLRHMVLWGMGLPMGVAAWGGFLAALGALVLRGNGRHLLVTAWAGLCFAYFGSQLGKPMRYLMPAYPFFILLGAWALVALADLARRLERRYVYRAALALTALVILGSAAWAAAFTSIYTRPVSRIAASQWIYENVPRGAAITFEHWDDPLPVRLPGYDPGQYRGIEMPMYGQDDPAKLELLVRNLGQADYLILSSNRLYGSTARMPERYPLTIEFYRRLFSGELGFELAHTETSYPRLGPLVFNDDTAEESFTVYDHPKVLIYRKGPQFSAERVRQLLAAVPLDNVRHSQLPIHVGQPNLMMPDWLRRANQEGGTWSEQFSLGGIGGAANALAPLTWYFTVQALALLAAPLLWLGLTRLPDRGYGIAKPLGLLAVSWLAWTLAGYRIAPWTRLTLLLSVGALAVASGVALRRHGAEWVGWLRAHRALLLATEGIFLAGFLLLLLFRAINPDLWHPGRGGEKPMEMSYLTAVVKTTYFPPYDPWYSGGYLNYYYFGYVLVAAMIKLTGTMPSVGFNVSLALLYGLLAVGCFSAAYNLSRLAGRPWFGLRGALASGALGFTLVGLVGNLDGFSQLIERLQRASQVTMRSGLPGVSGLWAVITGIPAVLVGSRPMEQFDFWRSSRVIVTDNTINEFPFWTFLFSDLHAHLISLPYQVAVLVVLLHLAQSGLRGSSAFAPPDVSRPALWIWSLFGWRRIAEIAFAGWLVGALYVINSWEFPTYIGLTALAFGIAEVTAQRRVTLAGAVRAALSAGAVFILAKPFFRPFWQWYVTFYTAVQPWTQGRSRLDHFLIIHGLLLAGVVTLAVIAGGPAWRRSGWGRYAAARWNALTAWDRFGQLERAFGVEQRLPATGYLSLLCAAATLALALRLTGSLLLPLLAGLLALLAAAAWERRDSAGHLFALLLAGTGTALAIFVELFALQGDIGRMNTVFKFYLQIWVLWGIVGAVALAWGADWLWRAYQSRRMPGTATWVWSSVTGALVVASLVYPLGATPARLTDRFQQLPPTLDGMAYMAYMAMPDGNSEVLAQNGRSMEIRGSTDLAAIRWLLETVKGSPVILEAQVPEYRWGGRIAKYTGLPAVLGWRWHQAQQRGTYAPQVDQRQRDVQTMFNDPSPGRLTPLLNKYGVRYVYVGDLERAYYSAAGLAKFDQMTDILRPVYREGGVTIYEVLSNVA